MFHLIHGALLGVEGGTDVSQSHSRQVDQDAGTRGLAKKIKINRYS